MLQRGNEDKSDASLNKKLQAENCLQQEFRSTKPEGDDEIELEQYN